MTRFGAVTRHFSPFPARIHTLHLSLLLPLTSILAAQTLKQPISARDNYRGIVYTNLRPIRRPPRAAITNALPHFRWFSARRARTLRNGHRLPIDSLFADDFSRFSARRRTARSVRACVPSRAANSRTRSDEILIDTLPDTKRRCTIPYRKGVSSFLRIRDCPL